MKKQKHVVSVMIKKVFCSIWQQVTMYDLSLSTTDIQHHNFMHKIAIFGGQLFDRRATEGDDS
jgi:hypothetical protein